MSFFVSCVSLFIALLLFFPVSTAANFTASPTITNAPVAAELKFFSLDHKDVAAVAIETRLPAANESDPSCYTFEPQYRIARASDSITITIAAQPMLPANSYAQASAIRTARLNQLTMTAADNEISLAIAYNPKKSEPAITTVKRKPVIQPDNSIIFRTYLVLTFADTPTAKLPKTIVLDPGHGGTALGATSNDLLEKELNLDIALLSRDLFRGQGYDVYLTRTDDSNPSLLDRADAANILQADLFLSIHNNSMPADMPAAAKRLYRGTTVLYNSSANKPAKELAIMLADQLAAALRIHQYPLQDRPGLVVLNATHVPAVIAEVAMMPHPQDAKMLSQRIYRLEAAQAIFQATDKYFSIISLSAGGI
ncbi:N-acetylmuramoyl-L-alanine amidase family protein [Sporomusa acidovorans]|uniref:MurNAc-LAA domain-containing protein n=1 Tax=Sporomusa acidovorans (strain ATCC 49682 / DSM 3132 / Mol) TaxID=1123286 RepID=A0ABZ3IVN4_SPOA4|nr:N-acetylmuramoyl-L-alanine amidase [Sporomusa acidovorans]OZC15275.1 N-acetylmuramoyl-L-alanine amidase LytC precursor [Sporomusa acidovorans DSM 3132]SDE91851.1 N-acetylmuramoyl-L-alanine amidase [Sporomusa acidovorans]